MRYTSKQLYRKLNQANQTLANIDHAFRLVVYGYGDPVRYYLSVATKEDAADHGSSDSVYGCVGNPKAVSLWIECYIRGAYSQAKGIK